MVVDDKRICVIYPLADINQIAFGSFAPKKFEHIQRDYGNNRCKRNNGDLCVELFVCYKAFEGSASVRLFQNAPSFISGAGGEIAVSLRSCVRAAGKAKASALYALVFKQHRAAVKIRLARPHPIATGGAQPLCA